MAAEVIEMPNQRREGKPLRAVRRHQRRVAERVRKMGEASGPLAKFRVAVDYFRSTAVDFDNDSALNQATQTLIDLADQLADTRRIR